MSARVDPACRRRCASVVPVSQDQRVMVRMMMMMMTAVRGSTAVTRWLNLGASGVDARLCLL